METPESEQMTRMTATDLQLIMIETESRLGMFGDGDPRVELDRDLQRRWFRDAVQVEKLEDK